MAADIPPRRHQDLHWARRYAQSVGGLRYRQRLALKEFKDLKLVGRQQRKTAKIGIQDLQDRILITRRLHVLPSTVIG